MRNSTKQLFRYRCRNMHIGFKSPNTFLRVETYLIVNISLKKIISKVCFIHFQKCRYMRVSAFYMCVFSKFYYDIYIFRIYIFFIYISFQILLYLILLNSVNVINGMVELIASYEIFYSSHLFFFCNMHTGNFIRG